MAKINDFKNAFWILRRVLSNINNFPQWCSGIFKCRIVLSNVLNQDFFWGKTIHAMGTLQNCFAVGFWMLVGGELHKNNNSSGYSSYLKLCIKSWTKKLTIKMDILKTELCKINTFKNLCVTRAPYEEIILVAAISAARQMVNVLNFWNFSYSPPHHTPPHPHPTPPPLPFPPPWGWTVCAHHFVINLLYKIVRQ